MVMKFPIRVKGTCIIFFLNRGSKWVVLVIIEGCVLCFYVLN